MTNVLLHRVAHAAVALGVAVLAAAAIAGSAPARPGVAAPTRLAVYLVRGEHVAPARRVVPHTTAVTRAALTALLRGPTAAERRAGYGSAIPGGTTLRGVTVSHGTATIDLARRFEAGGGSLSMLLRVAQVVHTATQFPSVHDVVFLIGGNPVDSIGGEGVIVAPRVGRASFESQSPSILVEQPLPGDTVRTPVVVRGTANVFEARLVAEIVTMRGTVLARKAFFASAGSGTRGSFETAIQLGSRNGRLRVVVYAPSAKDGSPVDVVRTPITLIR
jgi:hypothetical protein